MAEFIDASLLNQGSLGEVTENRRYIKYAADFTATPLDFQFPSGASTLLTFGIVKSMFIDNQNNDYELRVEVGSTQQSFPVPANSAGLYYIDAVVGSNIVVTPAGDPTDVVTFVFYNFERSGVVWYKTSTVQASISVGNGDDVALGNTADAAVTNPASAGTVVGVLKGLLSGLGATTSATVTNPATNSPLISFIRGILTGVNTSATENATTATQTTTIAANTEPYLYDNITTSTTTTVKNSPGVFGGVIVNTAGGAGTIIIEDGIGNTVATYDSTVAGPNLWGQGAEFGTNIRVITTGAPDITVLYK